MYESLYLGISTVNYYIIRAGICGILIYYIKTSLFLCWYQVVCNIYYIIVNVLFHASMKLCVCLHLILLFNKLSYRSKTANYWLFMTCGKTIKLINVKLLMREVRT